MKVNISYLIPGITVGVIGCFLGIFNGITYGQYMSICLIALSVCYIWAAWEKQGGEG